MSGIDLEGLLRFPPRGRSGGWLFALGLALVLAVQPIWGDRTAVGVAGAIAIALVAAARWQLRWSPVIVLVLCGMALRLSVAGDQASDVSDVTRSAIIAALGGDDPYGIGYLSSRPIGAPFPYGPIVLLWYLPSFQDPALIEFVVSVALLLFFGYRAGKGQPVGLAIFALAPPLVLAAMDGSNDTSAGLLIMAALIVGAKRPAVGAGLLAVAVAFKPYAIAWLAPLVMWAGLPTLAAFAVASLVVWSPVLFVWGPGTYLTSLAMAQETHLRQAYWSLGAIIDGIVPGAGARALETLRYLAAGAVAIWGGRRVRTIDGVILVGTVVFLIAQFGGYFGSYVYLAAVAPILCWRIDDWLRRGLPEVVRAYAEMPDVARRLRRPAAVPTPVRPAPGPARLVHDGNGPRTRTGRPTRTPTG
jgi:hypothetical protein